MKYKVTEFSKWKADVKAAGCCRRQTTKTKNYIRHIALKDGVIVGYFFVNVPNSNVDTAFMGGKLDPEYAERYKKAVMDLNK